MKLIVFDCDNTIWKIPYEENGEYMDMVESITNHDFEYNEKIIDIYHERKKDENIKFVILTNRNYKIQNIILEKIKSEKNIVFDYALFRIKNRDKSERLIKLICKIGDVDYIEFYDDKTKHIESIKKIKDKFPKITIKTFKL